MNQPDIGGHSDQGTTLVRPLELKLINYLTPRVPKFIGTYHLTISSLFFSTILIISAVLARSNINWFWIGIVVNICQYLADALDGEVGRQRRTGLIKWGFYVDHFFDYIFMCCLFIAHIIIWPADFLVYTVFMAVVGAFFVHEALSCVTSGKYNVRGYYLIGGTEVRIMLLVVDVIAVITHAHSVARIFFILIFVFMTTLGRQFILHQRQLWNEELPNHPQKI